MKIKRRGKYPPDIVLDFFEDEIGNVKVHHKTIFIHDYGEVNYQEVQFSNPENPKCHYKAYFNTWNQLGQDFKPPQDRWSCFEALVTYIKGFDNDNQSMRYLLKKYNMPLGKMLFRDADFMPSKKDPVAPQAVSTYSAKTVTLEKNFKLITDKTYNSEKFLHFFRKEYYPDEQMSNTYYCTENDFKGKKYFKNRIIFVFKEAGRIVHYSGRYIYWEKGCKINKWMHCPGSETHKFLGNIDTEALEVMLFESARNAWKLGDNGIFTQGLNLSEEQIKKIKRKKFKLIVICFDNDENWEAGPKYAYENYIKLKEAGENVKLFNWFQYCEDVRRVNDFGDLKVRSLKMKDLEKYFVSGLKANIIYKEHV